MSRDISSSISTAMVADNVRPALLFFADFDSGDVRLWSGYGDLSWDSYTWTGTGGLLTVSPIEETNEIKAVGANLRLSGIPSDLLSIALTEDYQGRLLRIYLALFDESNAIIANPVVIFSGRMDVMEIMDGSETASITLSVENRLIDLERPRARRYTAEDQKIDYPEDKAFDFIPSIQENKIKWHA